MLSQKEISENLNKAKDKNGLIVLNRRVSALPTRLANIGLYLLSNENFQNQTTSQAENLKIRRQEAQEALFQLNEKERNKLFNALFPNIAKYVEATWNIFDQLPYQVGYNRRPFRFAGKFPNYKKISWLKEIVKKSSEFYDQDILWYATWAAYIDYSADKWGYLFAGAISTKDENSQEVIEILKESAEGTHKVAKMGRHVVRGLLASPDPSCWDYIYRLLLSAQREEGLRQVILEAVDESQPQAFISILRLIVENNLCRFSAVIRAVDVWFGLPFDITSEKKVAEVIIKVLLYLESPNKCLEVIQNGSAEDIFFALWSIAFLDVKASEKYASELARSEILEKRFIATYFLSETKLISSDYKLIELLDDQDLHICAAAFKGLAEREMKSQYFENKGLFEKLEKLILRLDSEKMNPTPLVWDWMTIPLNRTLVANKLPLCLEQRPLKRLIPYLSLMEPYAKYRIISMHSSIPKGKSETKEILLLLCNDPSSDIKVRAVNELIGYSLQKEEIKEVESFLTKGIESVRRAYFQLLLGLDDRDLFDSIARLLQQKNEKQRLAGLELLNECKKTGRGGKWVEETAKNFSKKTELSESEFRTSGNILGNEIGIFTLDNALGLIDPKKLSPVVSPFSTLTGVMHLKKIQLSSEAAVNCLISLNQLIEDHKDDIINLVDDKGEEFLLANAAYRLNHPDPSLSLNENYNKYPMREICEEWWKKRTDKYKDKDNFELIRALATVQFFGQKFSNGTYIDIVSPSLQKMFGVIVGNLKYYSTVNVLLQWLNLFHPAQNEIDFILDAFESSIVRIPVSEITAEVEITNRNNFGISSPLKDEKRRTLSKDKLVYLDIAYWHRAFFLSQWENSHHIRLWKSVTWLNRPEKKLSPLFPCQHYEGLVSGSEFPTLKDYLFAYQAKAAKKEDLIIKLFEHDERSYYGVRNYFWLYLLSNKTLGKLQNQFPFLIEIIDEIRQRIIEIESKRGEMPTPASLPAAAIRAVPGINNLFPLLSALGKSNFARDGFISQDRSSVLSHLIRCTYPIEEDTLQNFSDLSKKYKIPENRLTELAVYAPQWATYVEQYLDWPKFAEGVWWLYAHTKDRQWHAEQDLREEWALQISEFTPLSADLLMDGAVDVSWFMNIYTILGDERWNAIHKAALYASGGNGHSRARLFADAMLGKINDTDLQIRIKEKRHQDSIRALGLIPLNKDEDPKQEVLRRYKIMQEFLRSGKKFGSQRKASETLAVKIGMENLARTAGYSDPLRLEWAMEREAINDLVDGPILLNEGEFQFSLSINEFGEPDFSIYKNDKRINTVPQALKKNEKIVNILQRKQELGRQVSRMRTSLEQSMCRGDIFPGKEISQLFEHPMLKEMVKQLIFISPDGMGYPIGSGTRLRNFKGEIITIDPNSSLRIAHPADLLHTGNWTEWQHDCFISERIQPFKQIFRELYIATKTEIDEGDRSLRYSGNQIKPHQALALFGSRGWVANPEEGVQKTFHKENITVHVGFLQGIFTPAEVEDLTLDWILFTNKGENHPLSVQSIPERLFSEVMRDVDLVVSTAHSGGVNPETTASTINARISLINETCTLLGISNYLVKGKFILIDGKLARYNIHLGSGIVHKEPGESLCIIPIHSQHHGRLFLPFVDNDPKTAEILSKVILLAQDEKIKDPTILEQIL